jgi:NTE family protein
MYKNLVFKGGGVRGIAYAGALQVLEDKKILAGIQKVAGTSAGAITAMLVALKYSAAGIKEIIGGLDFKSLEDSWDPIRIPSHYGLYAGDRALAWLETMAAAQAGPKATFADLRAKGFLDLHVVGTSLNKQAVQVFCADTTPGAIVSEAVRASMSIPLFFKAMVVQGIDDLFIDGGTVWNYPITIFDNNLSNDETLGLYLTDFDPAPIAPVKYGHIGQFIKSLFETLLASQDIDFDEDPSLKYRTLRIDALGIPATDFTLIAQQKEDLYQSGVSCATKFLA